MTTGDDGKRAVGVAAAELVEDGMVLGYGTGSTVAYFLEALASRRIEVTGVPTSRWTEERCASLGLPVTPLDDVAELDLTIDGADELDRRLHATKGGGGAHVREKVIATISRRVVIIATEDKLVDRLGETFRLPVEVVPFAVPTVRRSLVERGYDVQVRIDPDDQPFITDNGNHLLDCRRDGGIEDPAIEDLWFDTRPGVVTSGLFVDLVDEALLGGPTGEISVVSRPDD